jgi:hypothetical protein
MLGGVVDLTLFFPLFFIEKPVIYAGHEIATRGREIKPGEPEHSPLQHSAEFRDGQSDNPIQLSFVESRRIEMATRPISFF